MSLRFSIHIRNKERRQATRFVKICRSMSVVGHLNLNPSLFEHFKTCNLCNIRIEAPDFESHLKAIIAMD